jgi:hypothetical protein
MFRRANGTLQSTAASRSIDKGSLKFLVCLIGLMLLQQQITELLASGKNRTRSYGKLLQCVFPIAGFAHQVGRFLGFTIGLRHPGQNLPAKMPT